MTEEQRDPPPSEEPQRQDAVLDRISNSTGELHLEETHGPQSGGKKSTSDSFQGKLSALLEKATNNEKLYARLASIEDKWSLKLTTFERATMKALAKERTDRAKIVGKLEEQLEDRQAQIDGLTERLVLQDQALEKERTDRTATVGALKEQLEDKQAQMDGLTESLRLQDEALEEESTNRATIVGTLEEQLENKQAQIDGLTERLRLQDEALESAKHDREDLQREIKNILVTLHFQFEHLMSQSTTNEENIKSLTEQQKFISADIDRHVQDITTYVDSLQYEVSEIQLDAKSLWKQTDDEQEAAREKLEEILTTMVTTKYGLLDQRLQDHDKAIKEAAKDLNSIAEECESNFYSLQEVTDQKLAEAAKHLETTRSEICDECETKIRETEDNIHQTLSTYLDTFQTKYDDFVATIVSEKEETRRLDGNIDSLFSKQSEVLSNTIKTQDNWEQKFGHVQRQTEKQASQTAEMQSHLCAVKSELSTVFSDIMDHLTDLKAEVRRNAEENKVARRDFDEKHNEHTNQEYAFRDSIAAATERIEELFAKVRDHSQRHEALAAAMNQSQLKTNKGHEQLEQRLADWKVESDRLATAMKQRAESRVMAMREFTTKQEEVEKKLAESEKLYKALVKRMVQQEDAVANLSAPDLVEMSMQPWVKEHKAMASSISGHAQELKDLKDELKNAHVERASMEATMVATKQTWESLFQHLASKVKKDTEALLASKEQSQSSLKEMKTLTKSWENRFGKLSAERASSKLEIAAIQAQKLGLDSLQTKVIAWHDKIDVLTSQLQKQQESCGSVEEKAWRDTENLEKLVIAQQKELGQWKDHMERTIAEKEAKETEQLRAQQQAADKQAARIVLKAAKRQREASQKELEEQIAQWNTKFEDSVNNACKQISELQQSIQSMRGKEEVGEKVLEELQKTTKEWSSKLEDVVRMMGEKADEPKTGHNPNFRQELEMKAKELVEVQHKLQETTAKLTELHYECRGLRVQLNSPR